MENQEAAERLDLLGKKILCAARDELYLGMRFIDVALNRFIYQMDPAVSPFGTDGGGIYFHPRQLGGLYRQNRILVNRGYLHMVYHCIFRHLWKAYPSVNRPADSSLEQSGYPPENRSADLSLEQSGYPPENRSADPSLEQSGYPPENRSADPSLEQSGYPPEKSLPDACRQDFSARLWNLSCDIAVEHLIDGCYHRSVRFSRSALRREVYRKLEADGKLLNAERIFRILQEWNLQEKEFVRLEQEFYVDDHRYWENNRPDRRPDPNPDLQNKWKEIDEQMETDLETFSKEAAEKNGDLLGQVKVENRERHDYRSFLRKFSVLREELGIDIDTFDYTFYSYGLSLYGNMPLIEPQETKEVKKVQEFAVVVDTSMSCSGELVRKFLEETYEVLSESESFFRKVNIHIIQCDEAVQSDVRITNEKELKAYMDSLTLYGEGGTDFRPAFAYVDELVHQGEFDDLRGLIYFTDGYGIFPQKMPGYQTAFVFLQEDYRDVDVPAWAIKLVLNEEEILR